MIDLFKGTGPVALSVDGRNRAKFAPVWTSPGRLDHLVGAADAYAAGIAGACCDGATRARLAEYGAIAYQAG